MDDTYWCRVRWYIIPEETASGRQPHNLKREIYITNHFSDIEVNISIIDSFIYQYYKCSLELVIDIEDRIMTELKLHLQML